MTHEQEPFDSDERVDVTLAVDIARRLELFRDLVTMSDLDQESKQRYLYGLSYEVLIDEAVDAYLGGITQMMDKLFPNV